MSETTTVYQAESLSYAYGPHAVLKDVSFRIEAGRFYGIVGPNGSGKTTLLDLLVGAKQPHDGQIRLRGRLVSDYPKKELARLAALAPQEFAIDFPFMVTEVVMMGRHPHLPRFSRPSDLDWQRVRQAMTDIGVAELADQYVTNLSGGEKQRVVLARTLAQDTPAIVLDEPTSNLDIQHALHILAVVAEKVRAGRTAIAVMHDLNLAAAFCDELIFLKSGSVHVAGPKPRVLTPENVRDVFGVSAKVGFDEFSDSLRVSFKKAAANG